MATQGELAEWRPRVWQPAINILTARALPEHPAMLDLLSHLPPKPRRLVARLYAVPPSDDRALARSLGRTVSSKEARREATAAWNAFRVVLTAHFGEDDPSFPPPLGLEHWLL